MSLSDPYVGSRRRLTPSTPVDVEALRERYRVERDKRTATDDQRSYQQVPFVGRLAHFDKDPNATAERAQAPVQAELDVLIIGAGFMGLTLGAHLAERDEDDFMILDVAGDFGGTWYWNRYPGVRCDVESYIYFPLLEKTGYVPRERYSSGPEIFAYCKTIAKQFGLYDRALFQTRVTSMTWDEQAGRWRVETDQGDVLSARFVASQSGLFMRPHLPGVPGVETFRGHSFHTCRWDYAYTGGDSDGGLDKLGDKRIAVIGTGSTGLQVIPKLAESARSVVVFERTPSQVMPRDNAPTDEAWFRSQPPGWQQERIAAFDKFQMDRAPVDCPVEDGWTDFAHHQINALAALPPDAGMDQIKLAFERSDHEWNEMLRERVANTVIDPAKAEKLKAYYRTQCKRLGFSDDFLPAFNHDHVDLVDTTTTPIERITERGIVAGGHEYEVDCIIYATGFEQRKSWTDKAGYDVVGRGGQRLSEKFADAMRTHHGFLTNGFPNLFFLGFTQTATVANYTHLILEQAEHVDYIVAEARRRGLATVEATEQAEQDWTRTLEEQTATRREFLTACTPGTYNNDGKLDDKRNTLTAGIYLPGHEFFEMLQEWRAAGTLDGLTTAPA